MQTYNGKARLTTYVDVDLYNRIEEERAKTNESQSGILYSILEAVFREPITENA